MPAIFTGILISIFTGFAGIELIWVLVERPCNYCHSGFGEPFFLYLLAPFIAFIIGYITWIIYRKFTLKRRLGKINRKILIIFAASLLILFVKYLVVDAFPSQTDLNTRNLWAERKFGNIYKQTTTELKTMAFVPTLFGEIINVGPATGETNTTSYSPGEMSGIFTLEIMGSQAKGTCELTAFDGGTGIKVTPHFCKVNGQKIELTDRGEIQDGTKLSQTETLEKTINDLYESGKYFEVTKAYLDNIGLPGAYSTKDMLLKVAKSYEEINDPSGAASFYAQLGNMCYMEGDKDRAIKYYRLGNSLDPENRTLKESLEGRGLQL